MKHNDPFDTPFFREQNAHKRDEDEFFSEVKGMQRGMFKAAWPVIVAGMLFNLLVLAAVIWLIVWIVQQFT